MTNVAPALIEAVARRYGSLTEPDFSFVQRAIDAQPYAPLLKQVARVVNEVEDTTDVNDDVSFRYHLVAGEDRWGLDLSMVGPYGLLLRVAGPSPWEAVTANSATSSQRERRLLEAILHADVQLLSRETLEHPIPFRRLIDDEKQTRLYHALISDEPLPWCSGSGG